MNNSNEDGINELSRLIKQREQRKENLTIETRISAYRMQACLQKKYSEEKEKTIDYARNHAKEKKELNMRAVDDFFDIEVGEGHDFDFEDAQKGTNRLKRVFTRMYEGKKLNEKY